MSVYELGKRSVVPLAGFLALAVCVEPVHAGQRAARQAEKARHQAEQTPDHPSRKAEIGEPDFQVWDRPAKTPNTLLVTTCGTIPISRVDAASDLHLAHRSWVVQTAAARSLLPECLFGTLHRPLGPPDAN
jgi:hypothetical protein